MPDEEAQKSGGKRKTTRAVIDRIEDNDMAVVYTGDDRKDSFDLPVSLLPKGAEGGDHLHITITLDPEARAESAERVRELQEKLIKRSGTEGKKDFKL